MFMNSLRTTTLLISRSLAVTIVAASLCLLFVRAVRLDAAATGKVYVCPDCGCPSDSRQFDHPGTCPTCGSQLVEKGAGDRQTQTSVAVLLFDGAEIIDYAGPWEAFGEAGFKVFTVAERKKPIAASFGQNILPDYTFADCPPADILLVPGGITGGAVANGKLIEWVQSQSRKAHHIMSVCTGAFILAKAGLLDGLSATTVAHSLDDLTAAAPRTKVVGDRRYVDNGKIITTAGLSAGIDGAFHLIGKIKGTGAAQAIALGMEYQWDQEGKFVRATLADTYFPQMDGVEADVVSSTGDTTHWELQAVVSKPSSTADILQLLRTQVVEKTKRARSEVTVEPGNDANDSMRWNFRDEQGRTWNGRAAVEKAAEPNKFLLTLKLLVS